MKNPASLCIALTAITIMSCTQNNQNKTALELVKPDPASASTCYKAIDGKDTVTLSLNRADNKVTGKLLFNYFQKDKHRGEITGEFKGDTLLVDYLSTIGDQKTIYRNPLAFLKKDGKLVMGVGKIETAWGRNYFKKNEPIDYNKGRFVFEEVGCNK
ncbi:hypothetical protein ACSBL2_00535 [Pedobacter sp. AW31-3R]|uniref:hypothetical protein n=1 Tax=Pedobacter sp. AW31-3R TaxID=3445781 RepID=UPI003F9F26F4